MVGKHIAVILEKITVGQKAVPDHILFKLRVQMVPYAIELYNRPGMVDETSVDGKGQTGNICGLISHAVEQHGQGCRKILTGTDAIAKRADRTAFHIRRRRRAGHAVPPPGIQPHRVREIGIFDDVAIGGSNFLHRFTARQTGSDFVGARGNVGVFQRERAFLRSNGSRLRSGGRDRRGCGGGHRWH